MKGAFKFSILLLLTLTTLLSGCIFPGDEWGRGGHGERGDRGSDRGGERGGEHGDHR